VPRAAAGLDGWWPRCGKLRRIVSRPIASGPRLVPAIALTFDDGPGAVTSALLDVLRRHDAHATFNVLGERIAGRERVLQRMMQDGHEVGAHGWSHGDHRDDPLGRARDVARTAELVAAACGVRPRVFRPPFGLTDPRLEAAVAAHDLTTVLWDVDPRDYEEPGARAICRRTLDAIRPGSIVLLHDDRPELAPTAAAVDLLLGALGRRAWAAVTVSDLVGGPVPPSQCDGERAASI
jgi:peptidoglycan-N-acetylglucosamine deacetylase